MSSSNLQYGKLFDLGVCKTFEDKLNVFTTVLMHTWESQLMTQQEAVHFFASLAIASIDNYIAVWKHKYDFDSVRPFTAIKYLFNERLVRGTFSIYTMLYSKN